VTRTPGTQFRKLLSVVEVLDISIAPSGLAGPGRAWTAAAESETGRRSAVCEGLEGLQGIPCASCLRALDLNQRPLGYERKFWHHSNQDEPTQANDDEDLLNDAVGRLLAHFGRFTT